MHTATQPRVIHGHTLLEKIGEGAFGTVWRALAPGEFPAAVKLISRARDDLMALPELKALQAVRQLNSPNIVKVFSCWEEKDWLIIAMELADGNLRERFDQCRDEGAGGVPVDELLHYMREAGAALDYLHGLNKLHRDVKPENLLLFLGPAGHLAHCKLGDCGLVRDQDRLATMRPQGTPPYMPPEAWDCRPGAASDQFALAVMYVELRVGRRPFEGKTWFEVETSIRLHEPALGSLGEAEKVALKKALAKAPSDRYGSCREFLAALEKATGTDAGRYWPASEIKLRKPTPARIQPPVSTPPPTKGPVNDHPTIPSPPPTPPPQPPRPYPVWPAVLVGGGLVAVALAIALWPPSRPPAVPPKPDPATSTALLPKPDPPPKSVPEPVPVAVTPPRPKPFIPPGFIPAQDATRVGEAPGPIYYTRLARTVGEERVTLRLIGGAAPFYVMENKVWNGLYGPFAADRPELAGDTWKLGGKADGLDVGVGDPALPVLRVTRPQAEAFAAWLGGKLPTVEQLDRAAGGRSRAGDIAIGLRRTGPRPVGASAGDRSPDGVFDLAGNGLEWTRVDRLGGTIGVLRGRNYTASGPFYPSGPTIGQFPDVASPYTGFRVALDLSAP